MMWRRPAFIVRQGTKTGTGLGWQERVGSVTYKSTKLSRAEKEDGTEPEREFKVRCLE